MPDSIGANGLTVQTATEITQSLVTGLQAIYGADINTDQNSPDGQMIGILTQMAVDIRELIVSVNNGFDPDQALGAILDQRVTYNNIARAGGTYTVQPVDITVNATVTLQGLDANFSDPNGTGYTVSDGSGNQFILGTTITINAGTHSLDFRAQNIGAVSVPVDTIVNPVTIVLGVTAINNSSAAISVGQTEETDPQLRTRREQSVALSTTGYLNGLLGAIQSLPGVTEAVLYDNRTDGVVNTMLPHSIWLIVAGGAASAIANEIYNRISDGCNMNGAQTFAITTVSGALFVAKWDNPSAQNLYIEFTIQTTVAGFSFSLPAIKNYIVANLVYKIGQAAETSNLTLQAIAAIAAQGGGGVPLLMQVSSDGISYTDYLATSAINNQWTLDASRIAITVLT